MLSMISDLMPARIFYIAIFYIMVQTVDCVEMCCRCSHNVRLQSPPIDLRGLDLLY
jgi:hypothetical protein